MANVVRTIAGAPPGNENQSARLLGAVLWGVASLAQLSAAEKAIELDPVVIQGRFEVLAFPYAQFREMSERQPGRSFTLAEYTLRKKPSSNHRASLRHFLRDSRGREVVDLTREGGVYSIDVKYDEYIACSNQPVQDNDFYFLYRPVFPAARASLSGNYVKRLLDDYANWAEQRIKKAMVAYGAEKNDDFEAVRRASMPDELLLLFRDEAKARVLVERVGARREGRLVRISREKLDELTGGGSSDPFATVVVDQIECIAPWRRDQELPEFSDGAALYVVGWISYRPRLFARMRRDFVTLGLVAPR